jgi:hypothetical protein
MSSFNINLNFVILTTEVEKNLQYILSTDSSEIVLPTTQLESEWIDNLELSIIDYLKKNYIFVSDYDLMPQIISINSKHIEKTSENTLNIVYGFIVPYSKNLSDQAHWIKFNYLDPIKYSNLIFEVVQKLR